MASTAPPDAVNDLMNATRGVSATYHSSVSCYGMPYGWIGTVSHAVLYYSFLMVCISRKPLTWQPLSGSQGAKDWNLLVGIVSICGTLGAGIWGMVRCDLPWPLLLLATSKMGLGICCSVGTMIAVRSLKETWSLSPDGQPDRTLTGCWATVPYMVFIIVGLIGGVTLAKQVYPHSGDFRWLTIYFLVFGTLFIGLPAFLALSNQGTLMEKLPSLNCNCARRTDDFLRLIMMIPCISIPFGCAGILVMLGVPAVILGLAILFIFWVDWLVAYSVGNMTGLPDGHIAVAYWLYFWARKFVVLVW